MWKSGKNPRRREALLGELYETVLAPDRVPTVLSTINAAMDSLGVVGLPIVSLMISPHIASGKGLSEHYAKIDPRKDMGTRRPLGVGAGCHDFFDDTCLRRIFWRETDLAEATCTGSGARR